MIMKKVMDNNNNGFNSNNHQVIPLKLRNDYN